MHTTTTIADQVVSDALVGSPAFMTYREAAARLGKAERTIRRDVAVGFIRPIRMVGSHPRIARAELERVIREGIE